MKDKHQKPKHRRKPFFRFVKSVLRIFTKTPEVIHYSQDGVIEDGSILLSNHSGASGPLLLELYLDHYFVPWGTHEMNGTIKERWRYLNDIYFTQKKHYSKFAAFLISIPAVFALKGFYNGIELISTYRDYRLKKTFDQSIQRIDGNQSILIFPENSSEGYKETLEAFFPGFVTLAKTYYNRSQIDLPFYPIYVHKKENVILVGEKQYIQPLLRQGLSKEQIAEHFKDAVNSLKNQYVPC